MICVFFVAVIFRRHQPVAVWEIPEYIYGKSIELNGGYTVWGSIEPG